MFLIIAAALIFGTFKWLLSISEEYLARHPRNLRKAIKKHLKQDDEVLIVISHPDDECMFFTPTIRNLVENGISVKILCLTNGNHKGLGEVREQEFVESCQILKVENFKIINNIFEDSPHQQWDSETIKQILNEFLVENPKIKMIVSFDEGGVSNHPNHRNTGKSVYEYVIEHDNLLMLELETVPIFYKYSSLLALSIETSRLILEYFIRKNISGLYVEDDRLFSLISFNDSRKYGFEAMYKHKSQMLWFRKLYLYFSSYLYINTLYII